MKNIIFIAPPAAGKGTQSDLLKSKYGYTHISTGDLLREEIATNSPLGKNLNEIISQGRLVDDKTITEILAKKLQSIYNQHFILDGYPRNLFQAEELDKIFKNLNITNYLVLYLHIEQEVALKRATGRIICSKCGAIYHLYNEDLKPKQHMICDKCGSSLYQRPDDNEEAFTKRFSTYLKNTAPLIQYYKEKAKLVSIEVSDIKEETLNKILVHLEK